MQLEDQAATGDVNDFVDAIDDGESLHVGTIKNTPNSADVRAQSQREMDDTIREKLREIQARSIEDKPEQKAPASPEEKAQHIRDEQGKFAAKEADPLIPVDPVAPAESVSTAPNTWKKESHDAWSKADPVIRAEVERREADFHRGIEQYRAAATYGQTMERAMHPFAATIQSLGITPDKAVGELMAADHRLRSGDMQYFAQLATSYRFDHAKLAELFNGQSQNEQQYIDPTIQALQDKVQRQESWIQNQSLMGQQQQEAALNSEIATFAADPSHSHFESVKGHMSALLQAGQAKDLADAYEQAIYANPTTRGAVLQQQATAQREEAAKKAQAARTAASVNVRSRPSMPVSQPIGSMDDTIRATLRRLQSA